MRQRRTLITGSTGQLSRALQERLRDTGSVTTMGRPDIALTDWRAVRDHIAVTQPDVIIHAAAMTDVDGCERDPEAAWQLNATATRYVANAAALAGATLLYVSTNYVFDGTKATPYHEYDVQQPISVYGASKLAGEREAGSVAACFVVRTAWVYASEGRNFMVTMRRLMAERERLSVVNDQIGNPTLANDLADAILRLIDDAPFGTYHVTNSGTATWFDWANEIRLQTNSTVEIDAIPGVDFPRVAKPPQNGSLESQLLPGLGIEMPDWRDALKRCLHR